MIPIPFGYLGNLSYTYTGLPFGDILAESPTPATDYYASPCIFKSSTGRFLYSHDIFGSGADNKKTRIYYSDSISSNSWTLATTFSNFIWGTLFEYSTDLYIVGSSNFPVGGVVKISKSTDDGATWSAPTVMLGLPGAYDGWHTSAINPIFKDGYFVKAFELRENSGGENFAEFHHSVLVFADLTDLTDSGNWSYSNVVDFNGTAFEASMIGEDIGVVKYPDGTAVAAANTKGFLEGNIVEKSTGDLIVVLRLDQTTNSNHAVYLDVTWNSGTPTSSTLGSTHNFIEMPGGNVKFQILWDSVSSKHWAVVNDNRYRRFDDNRIEGYLISSDDDCATWTTHEKVCGFTPTIDWETEIPQLGTQYAHSLIVNNDLYILNRTANEDADDWHNANLITLTVFPNFRTSTAEPFVDGCMIIDENSERFEDVNGVSIIKDQSKYHNSPFMLTADNALKVDWSSGLAFTTSNEYLRLFYERTLMLDYGTGLTIYVVVENLQDIGGKRILSFGDTGADDTQTGNWFYAVNTGLGVETARGVYTDISTTNDYIFASSFDASNDHIYNLLNGANRGDPPTKNACTWDTDHIVMTTGYTGSYISELRIGNRIVGSTQPFSSLIKAIHIIPSFTSVANMITYSGVLNSTYSIY